MRNGTLPFSALAPRLTSIKHGGWTGRIILAALLTAAFAIALTPDRASAHHTEGSTYADHCRDINAGDQNGVRGSLINEIADSQDFIQDCINLLKAAESLTEGAETDINWLFKDLPMLPILTFVSSNNFSAWSGVWIEEVGSAPNQEYRIVRVDLPDEDLGGKLSPVWAELSALTTLNFSGNNIEGAIPAVWADEDDGLQALTSLDLSGNQLSGTLPSEVWEFLDGLDALNLDDNKDLRPSPPLGLGAVSSETANGDPQVALSFDNIWYTLEIPRHEYRYSADGGSTWGPNTTADSGGWMSAATGCADPEDSAVTPSIDPGTPVLCDKDDGGTPAVRNRVMIETGALPESNTYIFQVRAVKDTPYTDDKGTPGDTSDDTDEVQTTSSQIAQIDVVGPQVLTAESDFLLELDVAYTVNDPMPDAAVLVVESDPNGLQFTPKAATEGADVAVHLTQPAADVTDSDDNVIGQTGGSHTFPVDIKPASGAPRNEIIPNRSMLTDDRPARVKLDNYFQGDGLTYVAGSSKLEIATVAVDEETRELVITPLRAGVANITVIATDVNRGKATDTFRLTVVSPNIPPEVARSVPDRTLFLDDAGTQLDMTPYFRDEDGDVLRFIPQSSSPNVVTASPSGKTITFNVVGLGVARMTVIAEDPAGATAFVVFTVTVLEPNEAPAAVGAIPAQTLRVGDPSVDLDLAPYFIDPDGDELTFAAQSADESVAIVEIAGSIATMTGIAAGKTTLTVTATDPMGESELQAVAVMVLPANSPPEAVGSIGHQVLVEGGSPLTMDLAEYFSDPDGDPLAYAAESSNAVAVRVSVVEGTSALVLSPLAPAEAVTVTVTAMDGDGASAEQTFMVTVAAASGPAVPTPTTAPAPVDTPTPTEPPAPTSTPVSPASPEATSPPEATATPAPDEGGGFPWGWILALLVLAGGIGAAVFFIRQRGNSGPPEMPI